MRSLTTAATGFEGGVGWRQAATLARERDAAPSVRVAYKKHSQACINAVRAEIAQLIREGTKEAKGGGWERGV